MSLLDWLRGWQAVADTASTAPAFERALEEIPRPGGQRFIPAEEMTDEDWELARFSDPQPPRSSLFKDRGDPASFPMP